MMQVTSWKDQYLLRSYRVGVAIALVFAVALLLTVTPGHAAGVKQKTFQSPEEAVEAFVGALKAYDRDALVAIFGTRNEELLSSGDEVDDKAQRELFVKLAGEKKKLTKVGDKKVLLSVGNEEWPFPIPIVKKGNVWYFNTKAGEQEMIDRRIGRNELGAIQVCMAYADAQREYALMDLDQDGLFEYADKFVSGPGKKDGLYWETKEGEKPSPLGAFVAAARQEGYADKDRVEKPAPYHGYYYKILTAQGKHAPGGAYDYKVDGRMIGGFAIVAYPARYGSSGIMTFMINHNGVVFQKNLGKNTEKVARSMKVFDPDKTWTAVE
jgi:hypothetical protein